MKTKLEKPIKIESAQLDRMALLEDVGSSSPRGYQKPTRRENMMFSNAKFVEQEAQQQQVKNSITCHDRNRFSCLVRLASITHLNAIFRFAFPDVVARAGSTAGWGHAHSAEYERDCYDHEQRT